MRIDVYHHFPIDAEQRINQRLDRVFAILETIKQSNIIILSLLKREEKEIHAMAKELDEMILAITEIESVGESTIAAMEALAAKVDALVAGGGTPEQFAALTAEMRAKSALIATAIQANARP
jgi:uncharacterized protein related to proFAR isomerase